MHPRNLWEQADLRLQQLINDARRETRPRQAPNPSTERDDEQRPQREIEIIEGT